MSKDHAARSENRSSIPSSTRPPSSPKPTRRQALKGGGAVLFGSLAATNASAQQSPWQQLQASYSLTTNHQADGESKSSQSVKIGTEVVGREGDILIVESTTTGTDEERTSTSRVPISALTPTLPGKAGRTEFQRTVDQPNVDRGVTEQGTVDDEWITSFSGTVPLEDEDQFELSFELQQREGEAQVKAGRGLMLLPLLVPPTDRDVLESTVQTSTESPQQITPMASVTRYAYSRLITKDNQPADLTTARSDFQAWGTTDSNDDDFVDADYNWTHQTLANWFLLYTDTTTFPGLGNADVWGTAAYQGYFPLSPYEHFRDYHYHDHTIEHDGHYTELEGTLEASEFATSGYVTFKTNTFYDGSTKYSTGSRQTGQWYII